MKKNLLLVSVLLLISHISFGKENNTNTLASNAIDNNFTIIKSTAGEKHRIWLDLTNAGGAFKQTLIGYVTNATNGFDKLYDGPSIDSNPYIDFYSINLGKNLTIQGRGLPFVNTDEVPLGYKTTISGTFEISIDHVDGLFVTQDIFLKDLTTGVIHNLKNGAYSFTTEVGRFNDRFILLYIDSTSVTPTIPEEPVVAEGTEPAVVLVPDVPASDPIITIPEVPAPIVTEPAVTDPVVIVPEVPAPIVTEPVAIVSEEPAPVVTEPIVTVPEEPVPVVSEPEVTDPIVTIPEEPAPIVTEPVATDPIVIIPEESAPVVTAPEVTDPIVTVPEEPVSVGTEPEVTIPEVPAQIVTEPVATEPTVIVPDVSIPIVSNGKNYGGKGKAVFLSVNNSEITISSSEESINEIYIYSLGQRQLFGQKNINTNEVVIPNLGVANQVLIVKTQLSNGKWSTNKIVL